MVDKVNSVLRENNQSLITEDETQEMINNIKGAIGRPHLAQLLVDKKIVKDFNEAFNSYLVELNVPKRIITLQEGSELIKNAGNPFLQVLLDMYNSIWILGKHLIVGT